MQITMHITLRSVNSATAFTLGHIFPSPIFSSQFTNPRPFPNMTDTFHAHTKGEEEC